MHKIVRNILLIAILISSGCTAHRASPNRTNLNHHIPITLHGFFGSTGYKPQVRELIPKPGASTPLPSFWLPDMPLESFAGPQRPLYTDSTPPLNGSDNQCTNGLGLECSTLAFYAGHGVIDGWNVPSNRVPVSEVKIGDGALRYFWLHSCNVMAHGPEDSNGDYSQPYNFQAGRDAVDVFKPERWGHAFGPGLRMVCGGSSFLRYVPAGEIWNHLLGAQKSVPDAFILGLAHLGQTPVCLARGNRNPISSALSDRTLHSEGFRYTVPGWLHLQMPMPCNVESFGSRLRVRCGGETPATAAAIEPIAPKLTALPVVTTTALPPPHPPEERRLPLGFQRLTKDSKYHPDSGAVVLIKRRDRYSQLCQCNQERTWIVNPKEFLEENHLDPKLLPSTSPDVDGPQKSLKVTALEMRVESRQDGAPIERRKCRVRSLFLRYDTEIKIGVESFPIFGPGINFEMNGEAPRLASFSAPNRELAFSSALPMPLKLEETAISEAHEELNLDPEIYPEGAARATPGYEEAPLHCRQKFLRPTYEILFPPNRPDYPIVIIRRDARADSSEPSWTCQSWNDDGNR